MYGELSAGQMDELLQRHRFGRLGFVLNGEVFIIPVNYGYNGNRLYGHAPEGTKVQGMRQNPEVAFEVDEIDDPAHWRSVLVQGRYRELHERVEKEAAFRRIVLQAGGGESSEVTWGMGLDHLVIFAIEVTQRHGRFEQREAYGLRPGPRGPLPPVSGGSEQVFSPP
jgi:nitroimidazol reductase NimA-like FMN-containing flavoprotein (pyridoxamine 5'-phosphate oxidase superfamily)